MLHLWQMSKILTKHAGDKGDGQEDCGYKCELLHYSIEPVGDSGKIHVQHATHQVTIGIQYFECAYQVVMYICEIGIHFRGDEFACARHQRIDDFNLWTDHAPHLCQRAFDTEDTYLYIVRRGVHRHIFQVINNFIDIIEHWKVAIDECIEESI